MNNSPTYIERVVLGFCDNVINGFLIGIGAMGVALIICVILWISGETELTIKDILIYPLMTGFCFLILTSLGILIHHMIYYLENDSIFRVDEWGNQYRRYLSKKYDGNV